MGISAGKSYTNDCTPEFLKHSLWDRRMIYHSLPMRIQSFFPYIERGTIDHETVSHYKVEQGLKRGLRISLVDRLKAFFDI